MSALFFTVIRGCLLTRLTRRFGKRVGRGFGRKCCPVFRRKIVWQADLGVDPGRNGCQSFEATDFLLRRRFFDPTSVLILWQIGFTGNLGFYREDAHLRGLKVLAEVLQTHYCPEHEVTVYEAAVYYPVCSPTIQRMRLCELPNASVTPVSTLYVPPKAPAPVDAEMMARLGISVGPGQGRQD
jgi:hypothetical protein